MDSYRQYRAQAVCTPRSRLQQHTWTLEGAIQGVAWISSSPQVKLKPSTFDSRSSAPQRNEVYYVLPGPFYVIIFSIFQQQVGFASSSAFQPLRIPKRGQTGSLFDNIQNEVFFIVLQCCNCTIVTYFFGLCPPGQKNADDRVIKQQCLSATATNNK